MTLGERIRARREVLGLTQSEVADRQPGLDSNAISRWERDINVPSITSLTELAIALETTPDELTGYSVSLAERVSDLERRLAEIERST